jgi:hypothetical protein
VSDEQRIARWEAMAWSLAAASLRKDVDGLNRLVDEMDLDDARNAVYVLAEAEAEAVADHYRRHARMTGNCADKLLDEITFVSIERGFAADSSTGGDSTV